MNFNFKNALCINLFISCLAASLVLILGDHS